MTRQVLLAAALTLLVPQLPHAQTPARKAAPAQAKTTAKDLPPMKKFPTAKAVVDEHMDAINHCDWTRLMAQYPNDVEFFLPGGQVVKGREAVGDLFRNFVKPVKDGGLCGLKFTPEHVFVVGDTFNVAWVGNAEFLKEPYRGADAYETKNGMMQAQVTTFDGAQLKLK
jgi:SnoaL-like protein